MLEGILIALTLGSPPGTPPDVAQPTQLFDPVRVEVTVDDDGTLEILAFDGDGALLGDLLTTAGEDLIRIDSNFPDGYASVVVSAHGATVPPGVEPIDGSVVHDSDALRRRCAPNERPPGDESIAVWTTDLDPCVAAIRVSKMFGMVPRWSRGRKNTRRQRAGACACWRRPPPSAASQRPFRQIPSVRCPVF